MKICTMIEKITIYEEREDTILEQDWDGYNQVCKEVIQECE